MHFNLLTIKSYLPITAVLIIILSSTMRAAQEGPKVADDSRLTLLAGLISQENSSKQFTQANQLESIEEIFALMGPKPIQQLLLDYAEEGRQEFDLDVQKQLKEMHDSDRKILEQYLQKYERELAAGKIRIPMHLYVAEVLKKTNVDGVRLDYLLKQLYFENGGVLKRTTDEITETDPICGLDYVNFAQCLQGQMCSNNPDALRVKRLQSCSFWDLTTGKLIDYRLEEPELVGQQNKDNNSGTSNGLQGIKRFAAYVYDTNKIKLIVKDEAEDVNRVILASVLKLKPVNVVKQN